MDHLQDALCILLVDDDEASLRLYGRFLESAGYRVLTAANGHEGMERVLASGPMMIVTDWVMPGMDGLEFCRAVRNHEASPFAYIIVLTANDSNDEDVAAAFEAGADDCVAKPIKRRALLARVRAGERIVRLHQTIDRRNHELHRANTEMAVTQRQLAEANERLQKLVVTDELTGLANRREAMRRLAASWAASVRRDLPLSCIAIDVDRFKNCNDTYGHAAGDAVLRHIAETLAASARVEESVCRFGGEEFLVICPQSSAREAWAAAERLRAAIENTPVRVLGTRPPVTISLGVAERTTDMRDADALLSEADRALYEAKHAGRNRTVIAGCTPPAGTSLSPRVSTAE
jgi:diguanylate cyclase (GGDEF)-like protein